MAAATTVLVEAIHELKAHEDFTRLSGDGWALILAAVLAYQSQRLVTAFTGS